MENLEWKDKVDGQDDILAEDINAIAKYVNKLNNGKVDKVDGYGLSKNDFTDEDKQNLEFHDTVAREYLETKANIREHFMYDTNFNITEDDSAEVESISRLSKYVDELGEYIPITAKLKDTKAREMIGDIETALDSIIAIQNNLLGVSE